MADNKAQSFENHAQIVPMFHYVTLGILLLTFIGACVNLNQSWGDQRALLQRVAARHTDAGDDARGALRANVRAQGAGSCDSSRRAVASLRDDRQAARSDGSPSDRSSAFASRPTKSWSPWHSAPPIRTSRPRTSSRRSRTGDLMHIGSDSYALAACRSGAYIPMMASSRVTDNK